MKPSEFYENRFPLEYPIPELDESEVLEIVRNCDYTYEADLICENDKIDNKVNTADATVFYMMGYNKAKELFETKLKPVKL